MWRSLRAAGYICSLVLGVAALYYLNQHSGAHLTSAQQACIDNVDVSQDGDRVGDAMSKAAAACARDSK